MKLTTLRKRAQETTHARGHAMRWDKAEPSTWYGEPIPGKYTQQAECKRCGRHVTLRTKPMPNEINIGGEALAVNCEGGHHG